MPSDDEHARTLAWEDLAPGFMSLADVVEAMRQWAEDEPDSTVDPDAAEAIVHELWAARQAYLATPPARTPTDDVRVADAFALLERQGLVARMCCGWDQEEAKEECKPLALALRREGYVCFHAQDAARLAYPDATLFLGFDAVPPPGRERFGSREAYDAAALVVGHRIAQTMVDHGLDVRWEVSPTARIQVVGLDWRRPPPPD